jgi:hypothetical protein
VKSPILIVFIIFNLLAVNLVSATVMYDEETTESHLVQSPDDSVPASCIDESSCDHFCHISAHMLGFISHATPLANSDASIAYPVKDEPFHSLTVDPPTQPPQA